MINITVQRSDFTFTERLRWRTTARRWALETGLIAERAVKAKAPVGDKPGSGRLRDSIHHVSHVTGSDVGVEVVSNSPYAGMVIRGTPPHVIVPVRARALHWQQDGVDVYRQLVNHPGARPNPFPRKALEPLVPVLRRRFRDAMITAMEGR